MNVNKSTSIHAFFDKTPNVTEVQIIEWMSTASDEHLQQSVGVLVSNVRCCEHAKSLLQARLSQQSAELANKPIQHAEKLTQQTDIHIQHSEKLTRQTDWLVKETVK